MKKISGNIKLIIMLLVGIICSLVGVTAATLINGKEVAYDYANSKLEATNTQDAIDELYSKSKLKNRPNIVEAYTYNQTSGAENYCVTGDEETCVETICYENTQAGSCPAGTIIIYKLNENETGRFHVMYDNGDTLTMQSQRNTIYSTAWIDKEDYAKENTAATTCSDKSCGDKGPITILNALESATAGWTNVNTLTYTMGTTVFKNNTYTGCSSYDSCDVNVYILPERSAKVRMITVQEANDLGCTRTEQSCPVWMYNYLSASKKYGGTINDSAKSTNGMGNSGYWTMNVASNDIRYPRFIHSYGYISGDNAYNNYEGARAVIEINK